MTLIPDTLLPPTKKKYKHPFLSIFQDLREKKDILQDTPERGTGIGQGLPVSHVHHRAQGKIFIEYEQEGKKQSADPDPGSGAFLTPGPRAGTQIRD
jgi:hypothetical protein